MPRFLHTADWQIGRQYAQLPPDDAVPLAEARLQAVETIARLAAEQAVDAVLVAGDVFDAQTVADRTIRRLLQAIAGWSGPWVLIPGNHDAALAESVWTRMQRLGGLPPQLAMALTPQVVPLANAQAAVLTAPLTQRHTYDDTTAWFDAAETPAGWLRLGLAHGSVQGVLAEEIDSANPIAADRAARARLDYLALGDWHGCKSIDTRTWYSGTPEPDRYKSNQPGHVLLVEIDAPGALPRVTPIPTGRHDWQAWELALAVASDVDAVVARLAALGPRDVLDLRVHGRCDLAGHGRLREALAAAEARVRSLRCDLAGLRLAPTEADLAALQADGYVGEVIAALRERAQAVAVAGTASAGTAADAGPPPDLVANEALLVLAELLRAQRAPAETAPKDGAA